MNEIMYSWLVLVSLQSINTSSPPVIDIAAPEIIVTDHGVVSVSLSWADPQYLFNEYHLEYKNAANSDWNAPIYLLTTSYIIEQLTPFTSYNISLKTSRADVETYIDVVTTPPVHTQGPSIHVISSTFDSLTVSWPEVLGAKHVVHLRKNETDTFTYHIINGTQNSYHFDQLNAFTKYIVGVIKVTVNFTTNRGPDLSVMTKSSDPGIAPVVTSLNFLDATSISIGWLDINEWGSLEERKFCVVVEKDSSQAEREQCLDFPTLNTTITDLQPYTEYNISVYCKNNKGSGPKDGERKSVRTDELPPDVPPTEIEFPEVQSNNLTISWTPPPDDEIAGIIRNYSIVVVASAATTDDLMVSGRRIRRSPDTLLYSGPLVVSWSGTADGNETHMLIDNIFGNTEYNVSISSNTKYLGVYSQGMLITTLPGVPLLAAWDFRCGDATFTNIQVLWNRAPDLLIQGSLVKYVVFVRKVGEATKRRHTQNADEIELQLFLLHSDTEYAISMYSQTAAGYSPVLDEITCKTIESHPDQAPMHVYSSTREFPNATTVTWSAIPEHHWRGNLLGYVIYYKIITQGEMYIQQPWQEVYTNNINTSYVLTNLIIHANYMLKVAGYTKVGVGPKSEQVIFETCRVDQQIVVVNYMAYEPYIVPPRSPFLPPSGQTIDFLRETLYKCAGQCQSFTQDVKVVFKRIQNVSSMPDVLSASQNSNEIYVPVSRPLTVPGLLTYVKTSTIPVFVLLKRLDSKKFSLKREEKNVVSSVFDALNPFGLYMLINIFVGVLYYYCEQKSLHSGSDRSCLTIFGIFESLYLSFVTSSTIGYGDVIPRTMRSRFFIVVWSLMSLIITGMCVGHLSSSLTVTTIVSLKDTFPHAKVIAVIDSPEYQWGSSKISITTDEEGVYLNHSMLIDALIRRDSQYALVDPHVLDKFRQKLSQVDLSIAKVFYPDDSELGAILGGNNTHLYRCMKRLGQRDKHEMEIADFKKNITRDYEAPDVDLPLIKPQVTRILSSETPLFRKVLIYVFATWAFLCICGVIYEIYRRRQLRNKRNGIHTTRDTVIARFSKLREFCDDYVIELSALEKRLTENTDAILFRHGEEIMKLTKSYSKLYGVNFKYVAIKELGVPLEKIAEYREELWSRPVVPWHRRMRDYVSRKIAWVKIVLKID